MSNTNQSPFLAEAGDAMPYAGTPRFVRTLEGETIEGFCPVKFVDDFIGDDGILTTEGGSVGLWTAATVETGGSPSAAVVTDEPTGVVGLALDTTGEVQSARIDMGGTLNFDPSKGLTVEFRAKIKVLTDASAGVMFLGMGTAYNATLTSITNRVGFVLNGDGAIKVASDDGTTEVLHGTSTSATGVTATADDKYRNFRIEVNPNTQACTFFIDNVEVATSSGCTLAAVTGRLQPLAFVVKTSNDTPGTVEIDRVAVYQHKR